MHSPMRVAAFWCAAVCLVHAAAVPARADGIDDFNASWAGQSLAAQRLLDLDEPLADANLVGTHNSFNSSVYTTLTSYIDPDQVHSIFNQLRMGVRSLEFDVHWTPKTEGAFNFPDRLLLCHGTADHIGCSVDDRYFTEGLDEIAAWLGTSDSIDQVVVLHIEDHMEGQHGEAYSQVMASIGSRVYTSGGCGDIPGSLTKADVLAAGKNVVIWNEGGCTGDANWNGLVYTGLGGLSRVWETSGSPIGDADVSNLFATGTNIIDLEFLDENDSRWSAAIWSWNVDEPNDFGGEDCAAHAANTRWNDDDCAQLYRFACENTLDGSWAVSPTADSWGVGGMACAGFGAEYRFSVPTQSQDNQALVAAKGAAGQAVVWLNHDDRSAEGDWQTRHTLDVFYDPGALVLNAGQGVSGETRLLRMDADCDLVLYSLADNVVGGRLWNTETAGAGSGCHADFQPDGNFVLYDGGGSPQWNSSTSGAELRVQSDGNVVIYDGGGAALWQTYTFYPAEYVINAGSFSLASGQVLHSGNRKLEMRSDCNLVLHSFENGITGGVVWQSDTKDAGSSCHADFQVDGNFVVYDGGGAVLWNSGTSGTFDGELWLQEDGNLVVYNGASQSLWTASSNLPAEGTFLAGQLLLDEGQWVQTQTRRLTMQDDCNLVLHSFENAAIGGTTWQSNTTGAGVDCYADLQPDGNFVVYDGGGTPLWNSGTSGTSGAELRIQQDGNMVLYNGVGQPLWSANSNLFSERIFTAGNLLLNAGDFALSQYRLLEMQADCNLVLYSVVNAQKVSALWNSDTQHAGSGCYLDFQSDGNLVLYDEFDQPLWASGTSGTTNAELHIQDDGNLVIYNDAAQPLWSTGTQGLSADAPVCGDLVCEESEAYESCPIDCEAEGGGGGEPPAVPGLTHVGGLVVALMLAGVAVMGRRFPIDRRAGSASLFPRM